MRQHATVTQQVEFTFDLEALKRQCVGLGGAAPNLCRLMGTVSEDNSAIIDEAALFTLYNNLLAVGFGFHEGLERKSTSLVLACMGALANAGIPLTEYGFDLESTSPNGESRNFTLAFGHLTPNPLRPMCCTAPDEDNMDEEARLDVSERSQHVHVLR